MFTFSKAIPVVFAISAAFISYCCAEEEGSPCTMKTGEPGICTLRPQCKSIDEALMRRKFPFKNLVICSFVGKIEVICCTDNVGVSTPDPSVIILNQGGNSERSALNSSETIANVSVEKVVTIGNIHITDKEEFIDLAQIGKNLIQESAERNWRQTEIIIPRSQSTTKRPSANVRDLPVYDVTTRWPSTSTKQHRASLHAVRDVNFIYDSSDTGGTEVYGSGSSEENVPTTSIRPFWGKWNWFQQSTKLTQEPVSTYKPPQSQASIKPYNKERLVFWDEVRPVAVGRATLPTKNPEATISSERPRKWKTISPAAGEESISNYMWAWPDTIKTFSETTLRPKQTSTIRGQRLTPGLNVPSSSDIIISTPPPSLSSTFPPSSVLDEWMINVLLETSGSATPSLSSSTTRTSTSPSFVSVPNSPDDNNVISPSTTPRNKEPVNLMPGSRASDRKADKVCTQYEKDFLQIPKPLDFHILDGEPAFLGEFPHMAALGYPAERSGQAVIDFRCGGSLISNRYVMTAAHCVRRREELPTVIRLGGLYLDEVTPESLDVGVDEVILNPQYLSRFQYHDIALIRINVTLPLDTIYIFPACLHTDRRDLEPNLQLVAAGWGWTSISKREQSTQLLKANLSTVNLAECNQRHMDYEVNRQIPNGLNEGQFCALDPDLKRDTCPGDSGGPLQIILESKLSKIYGITSFGALCGSAIPSVYARVSFYLDWLESVVWAGTS